MYSKLLLLLTATFAFSGIASAEPLNVGDDAPKVVTTDHTGASVDLGKELAEGTTLVYFYPKADTPGCTRQACNLRDEFSAVKEAGITVYGVSADTVDDQKAFSDKFELPFQLLADKKGEVIKAFGVPTNPRGFSARQSFLIRDGKVIWRDLKAKPDTQAKDAIAAAGGEADKSAKADSDHDNHETIEKVMKAIKGKESMLALTIKGTASDEDIKNLSALVATLKGTKAPEGDQKAYDEKVDAFVVAMAAVADGDKSAKAIQTLKDASNCKACHTDHKP